MPATRLVELPGLPVTVRELTVAEVRAWFVDMDNANRQVDVGREFAFDGFSVDDLVRMSDVKASDLDRFAPSDLAPLVDAAKGLNPHFFRARAAVAAAQSALLRGILRETPSSSPSVATP